tara:strand:+ start:1469 stop:1984 length:516 start_codon:yes stop_codon:yes gene_type:complete
MTHNSKLANNLEQWQEVIGEDADRLWQALEVSGSHRALTPPARPKRWLSLGKIAAALGSVGLVALLQWQVAQDRDLLRTENLQLRLLSHNAMQQLEALTQIQNLSPETAMTVAPQLLSMLTNSEDPNVQLSALEALIRLQLIRSAADLPTFTSEQGQARFIAATYQQLYGE